MFVDLSSETSVIAHCPLSGVFLIQCRSDQTADCMFAARRIVKGSSPIERCMAADGENTKQNGIYAIHGGWVI